MRHMPKLRSFVSLGYNILAVDEESSDVRLVPPKYFLLIKMVLAETDKDHGFY